MVLIYNILLAQIEIALCESVDELMDVAEAYLRTMMGELLGSVDADAANISDFSDMVSEGGGGGGTVGYGTVAVGSRRRNCSYWKRELIESAEND